MLGLIIYLFVVGIVAGYLARLLVPGPDPMSFWQTVGLGVVGSFVARIPSIASHVGVEIG